MKVINNFLQHYNINCQLIQELGEPEKASALRTFVEDFVANGSTSTLLIDLQGVELQIYFIAEGTIGIRENGEFMESCKSADEVMVYVKKTCQRVLE